MTSLVYEISEITITTITIYVHVPEGSGILMHHWTGFNLKDAIRNANKTLNYFGYYVE